MRFKGFRLVVRELIFSDAHHLLGLGSCAAIRNTGWSVGQVRGAAHINELKIETNLAIGRLARVSLGHYFIVKVTNVKTAGERAEHASRAICLSR